MNEKKLHCVVITPEKTLRDQQAEFVVLPLFDGEIGIAPGHTPMIGRLGSGEMRIREGGQSTRFYVEGGFVEVLNDVVSVLTARAMRAEDLSPEAAEEQLSAANRKVAHTPEEFALRDRLTSQSRAQIRVARRAQSAS